MPVSAIRTKIRQEFERHRYVSQLKAVDVLIFNSHSEFQVCTNYSRHEMTRDGRVTEMYGVHRRRLIIGNNSHMCSSTSARKRSRKPRNYPRISCRLSSRYVLFFRLRPGMGADLRNRGVIRARCDVKYRMKIHPSTTFP